MSVESRQGPFVVSFSFIFKTALFAGCVLVATAILFTHVGNLWLRAGLAVYLYGTAVRNLATTRASRTGLGLAVAIRIWAIASTVAEGLGCIGSVLVGGVIGWLGVFISLRVGLTGAWVLLKMTTLPAALDPSK